MFGFTLVTTDDLPIFFCEGENRFIYVSFLTVSLSECLGIFPSYPSKKTIKLLERSGGLWETSECIYKR